MICFKKSDELKMLQKTRTPGNKFSGIQPKLEIGNVDDPHEKEADAVADKVMRMPSGDGSKVARMRDDAGAGVRMKPEAEEEKMPSEDETKIKMKSDPVYPLQKKPDGGNENSLAPETVEQGISSSKGSGQSLDAGIREEMGSKIGADFSDVKVHTDNNAAQMSKEIGAKAFAHGQDIYFNQGQYNPASSEGKHLLAHELTHTVQQNNSLSRQSLIRRATPFAEAKANKDSRTFYINGAGRFNRIKQMLASVDVLFEGSPTLDNIVKKKPPGEGTTDLYVGKVSTTTATKPSVKKLLDALVASGGEVFVTKDEFVTKLQALVTAFRAEQPNTFSNLQVLSVIDQSAVIVNDEKSCIETMNKCIQNLYGTSTLKKEELSDTAFGSIGILKEKGLIKGDKKVSLDYIGSGRFQIRPENIETVTKFNPKSFSATHTEITKDKEDGLYVNVCSLFNGYHSILILVKKEKGVC